MQGPTSLIRCIKDLLACIAERYLSTPAGSEVVSSETEYTAGATITAGWVAVTLINQGDDMVTLNGASRLFPGSTISWSLEDFASLGHEIDFTFSGAGANPSLLVSEVR